MLAGLDIGTSKIKLLLANQTKKGELEFVSKIEEPSDGVRRGIIISPEKVSYLLKNILMRLSAETDEKINSLCVNLNGCHLFAVPSHGLISVSRADQKISKEDIQRVIQAAQTINLSSNKEIFDAVVREFIIDGQTGIKEPLGLQGVRLEAKILALGGFSPYLKNVSQAVLNSDLEVLDMIPSPLAASRASLSEKQKELGVCLLDIGAGTTGLAVFEEGDLIHMAVLPIGSANITNDITVGLKTDIELAEQIKIEYGSCFLEGKNIRRKIETEETEPLIFSQKNLVKIINDRISEIFNEVQKELKKISKEKLLPGGVVLTGGGANLPSITRFAKEKLHLPTYLGRPKGISGLAEDPSLAVVAGLILFGTDLRGGFEIGQGIGSRIKKTLKIFVP